MSNHPLRSAALACLVLIVAACSSAPPSPSPSGGAPTPSPTGTSLDHPTGATDVVLRFDEGGGFVPMEFIAAHVPIFTLYGDGTVVFQGVAVPMAPPAEGEPSVGQALRTGRLSEDQVQALLQFALLDGGLAAARDRYDNPLVADAPTATFEVHAAGDSKTVSVVALGMDAEPGPDTAIKAAFVKLAERLRNFDQGGTLPGAAYVPERYRGVLIDAAALQGAKIWPWPWADVAPADFRLPQEPNAFQQRTHTLTPAQAEAIGVAGYEGGIQAGLFLRGPDASLYTLVLRPLLPDEAA